MWAGRSDDALCDFCRDMETTSPVDLGGKGGRRMRDDAEGLHKFISTSLLCMTLYDEGLI